MKKKEKLLKMRILISIKKATKKNNQIRITAIINKY